MTEKRNCKVLFTYTITNCCVALIPVFLHIFVLLNNNGQKYFFNLTVPLKFFSSFPADI